MNIALIDHLGGCGYLAQAVDALGHTLTPDYVNADVLLVDNDMPWGGREELMAEAKGRVLVYPHGAGAYLTGLYDGAVPVSEYADGMLVIAEGQKKVAEMAGYPLPVHTIGWGFCDLAPPKTTDPKNILFAPTHGPFFRDNFYLAANYKIFKELLKIGLPITVKTTPMSTGVELVRGGWTDVDFPAFFPDGVGTFDAPGVTVVEGAMEDRAGQIELIDSHDLVVADPGTFGCLAVARGVPTVMWGSDLVMTDPWRRQPIHHPWPIRGYVRYPYDASYQTLEKCIEGACTEGVREWRERFVGSAFSPAALERALDAR